MVFDQELSDESKRVDRSSTDSCSQLPEGQTHETVGTTIEIILDELDTLEPDETANLERNLLTKHLRRLMKVATFSNKAMKGLRDEVQKKNELIKTLQETVNKKASHKVDTQTSAKTSAMTSPLVAPVTPPTCQSCANYAETKRQAQLLQQALQSLNTHIINLMRNNKSGSSGAISARSSIFSSPRQLRGELDRPCFIWDRETVRKLEEYPKLAKDKEILRKKLDEARQMLATSEYQRGGALITVDKLVSEVRRAKERIRVLEFKRSRSKARRGGMAHEAVTSKNRGEVDKVNGKRVPVQQRTTPRKAKQRDNTIALADHTNEEKAQRKKGLIAWNNVPFVTKLLRQRISTKRMPKKL